MATPAREVVPDACGGCGGGRRLTVSDCFERGRARMRRAPLPVAGRAVAAANGLSARFEIEVADGIVRALGFRATSCVTLVAYCEALAELVEGGRVAAAAGLQAAVLAELVRGVPAAKRDRAPLAVAALRAALAAADSGLPALHPQPRGATP